MPAFARQVLDALPMTVYTIDLEGRITSANRSWSQFASDNGAPALAPEASVCGQSLWSAVADPSYRAQLQDAMEQLRLGKAQRVSWEFPCSSPDEERVFLMQVTPLHDPDHRVTGYVFSTVDITPSHRSREALIDTGLAISRTIDLDRVYQEVGYQLQRAVGADAFAVLLTAESHGALERAYRVGYDDTQSEREDLVASLARAAIEKLDVVSHARTDGVEVAAPMRSGDRTIGAMTMSLDGPPSRQAIEEGQRVLATLAAQTAVAVERARLVQRVGHKRRLEAIGEVATGVAHEIRNPLFGISSAAQLLAFRSRDDPIVERTVGRILREVDRLNRMVTSLLNFGRPRVAVLVPADPDAVWDEVLDGQHGLLQSRTLTLDRSRPSQGGRFLVDAEQLSQVFLNVLVNACDHAPESSTLTLHSAVLPSGAWRCRLNNGGPVIPADVIARVFEMFYSNKPGGTGIGLALCQRIVEEHGGEISLASSPEHGTTVTITLPAIEER